MHTTREHKQFRNLQKAREFTAEAARPKAINLKSQ
jgi:hypothetical protein